MAFSLELDFLCAFLIMHAPVRFSHTLHNCWECDTIASFLVCRRWRAEKNRLVPREHNGLKTTHNWFLCCAVFCHVYRIGCAQLYREKENPLKLTWRSRAIRRNSNVYFFSLFWYSQFKRYEFGWCVIRNRFPSNTLSLVTELSRNNVENTESALRSISTIGRNFLTIFFIVSAEDEQQAESASCGKALIVLSWVLVCITMPFSLFVCFKVSFFEIRLKCHLKFNAIPMRFQLF